MQANNTPTVTTTDRFTSACFTIAGEGELPDAWMHAMYLHHENSNFDEDVIFVYDVFTYCSYRGRGYTAALISEALRWSQTHYPELPIVVQVAPASGLDTARMVAYYQSLDFEVLDYTPSTDTTLLFI